MLHLVQSMAYMGITPWHQLGNQLPAKQPIKVWAQEVEMGWSICEAPVYYMTEQNDSLNSLQLFNEQKSYIVATVKLHCPLSASTIKSSSLKLSQSFIVISRKYRVSNLKQLVFSRMARSSGLQLVLVKKPSLKVKILSTAICYLLPHAMDHQLLPQHQPRSASCATTLFCRINCKNVYFKRADVSAACVTSWIYYASA